MRNFAMKNYHGTASRNRVFISILTAIIVFSFPQALIADGTGSTTAGFLCLPIGGKAAAMGERHAALNRDPFGWLSNPAATYGAEGHSIGIFHSQWILDTYYDNVFYREEVNRFLKVGIAFTYFSSPQIQGFDHTGTPTNKFDDNTFRGIVGLTVEPIKGLSAGLNVNYFQEKLAQWTAKGYSADIGASYSLPVIPLSFGVVVQNLGPRIKIISVDEELPLTVVAGAGYSFPAIAGLVHVSIAADMVKPRYEDSHPVFGAEVGIAKTLFLRAGYSGDESRASDGFTAGGGININGKATLDYAWTSYGDLGSFHRVSLYLSIPDMKP